MQLVPRDLAILETVGELGTADQVMLRADHFPDDNTGRAAQRRLRMLVDEGLLTSKRLTAVDEFKAGSLPAMYFLTPKGADLVEAETGIRPHRVTQSDPTPFTLRHRLKIVEVRRAFDKAVESRQLPRVEWIMEQDTREPMPARTNRSPSEFLLLWDVFEHEGRRVTFRPDGSAHVRIPRPSGSGHKSLIIYFEIDRSTEGSKQWERKSKGISAFFREAGSWKRHWPRVSDPTVVLFVVCPSERRIGTIVDVVRSSPAGNRYRFAVAPLDADQVLTGAIWSDVFGNRKAILR